MVKYSFSEVTRGLAWQTKRLNNVSVGKIVIVETMGKNVMQIVNVVRTAIVVRVKSVVVKTVALVVMRANVVEIVHAVN
jgi:hypothetical protein